MSEVVGPFTIDDGVSAAVAADVRAVAAAIPAAIARRDQPGAHHISANRPARTPSWAYGYTPGAHGSWINPSKSSTVRRGTIAHEFLHGFDARHFTAADRRAVMALMPANHPKTWRGGTYTKSGSNRPAEGAADGFARMLGFGSYLRATFYTSQPSAGSFPAYGAILSGGGGTSVPGPFPSPSPVADHQALPPGAHLRASPDLAASVIRTVDAGGLIATGRGLTGSSVQLADGRLGSWWLEVLGVNGEWIEPPLWVSDLVVSPWPTPEPPPDSAPPPATSNPAP